MSVHATQTPPKPTTPSPPTAAERLDSWKEIASYLRRDERTVRRWEKSEGLPVHRHPHAKQASIYAYRAELDAWWHNGHERLAVSEPASQPRTSRRRMQILTAVALVVVVASSIWMATRARPTGPIDAAPRRIAFLPLRNLTGDAGLDFLQLGVAEVLADRFSYAAPRAVDTEAILLRFAAVAPELALAQDHEAETLLTGSYHVREAQLHLSLQLLEAKSRTPVWQRDFTTNLAGVTAVGDLVLEEIASTIWPGSPLRRSAPLREMLASPNAAHELFLRGLDAQLRQQAAAAIGNFEKALELNPNLAGVQVRLASAYIGYAYGIAPNAAYVSKGVSLIRSAMAQDAASPQILTRVGLQLMELRQLEDAVVLWRRAIELNPHYSKAHLWLSQAYRYAGALEESLRVAETAFRLDPDAREVTTMNTYLYLGELEKFTASLPQNPVTARTIFYRGLARLTAGDLAGAQDDFARANSLEPAQLHARYGEALRLGIRGEPEAGLKLMRELTPHTDAEMLYKMAQTYAVLNDNPSSLRLLGLSIDAGFFCHSHMVRDPLLANLRSEPEYESLMQLALQKQQAFRAKFL